jgi:hypothetical protein
LISSTNAGRQQAHLQISFDDGKSHGNPTRPRPRGDRVMNRRDVAYWQKADLPKRLLFVRFRGEADMPQASRACRSDADDPQPT